MERTKFSNSERKYLEISYNNHDEPIVISKATTDLLLKQENPGDLIALYWFYYQTAKWQKTNQPKCANTYIQKGLHWGHNKVQEIKNQLKNLHLIDSVIETNEHGIIVSHYVKVNFICYLPQTPENRVSGTSTQSPENRVSGTSTQTPYNTETQTPYTSTQTPSQPDTLFSGPKCLNTNKKNIQKNSEFLSLFPIKWQTNEIFISTINDFVENRKEMKKKLTSRACIILANKLKGYSIEIAIQSFNDCIERGWTSIFPKSINSSKYKSFNEGQEENDSTMPDWVENLHRK